MGFYLKLIPLEERVVLDAAAAAVIYVNAHTPAAPAMQTGADWAHAWSNLQSALTEAAAHPGEQIWIAKGTYLPSDSGDPSATFSIPDQTSLYGGFAGSEHQLNQRNPVKNPTILSGDLLGNNTVDSYTIVTIGATASESVTLDGLTITGADNTQSGLGGGLVATHNSTVTLSDVTFSNDTAINGGGAIYLNGIQSINIIGSEFLNDSAINPHGTLTKGGALFALNTSTVSINNSDFNGNTASQGGAVFEQGITNASVASSSFENNIGHSGGTVIAGAICFAGDTNVLVTYSTFDHNSVPQLSTARGGGAIATLNDHNEVFTYNTFTYNSDLTPNGFGGAAIYTSGAANSTISYNIFDHNNSVDTINQGNTGTVNVDTGGVIDITHNSFTNNTSDAGAAIGVVPFVSNLNIAYNNFVNNSVDAFGGAVFTLLNNFVSIHDNFFLKNYASIAGGAISSGYAGPGLSDTNSTISNNMFINNRAGQQGGAIASEEMNLTINNNSFLHNSAADGGAIADFSTVSLSINSNLFAANSGAQGNSVWLDGNEASVNGSDPTINPLQVVNNLVNSNQVLFSEDIYIA